MERRRFLRALGGATVGASLLDAACDRPGDTDGDIGPDARAASSGTAAEAPGFRGWTWVHGGGDRGADEWRGRFARLKDAGITAVLVSGGDTAMLSGAAHDAGLEFHRWLWILNRSGDAWVKENHPEWFDVSRNGESSLTHPPYVGYYQWLCPTREEVREYLRGVIGEVARDDAVDGVHLDYIRHPDVILPIGLWSKYGIVQDREYPQYDFCYCDVCRSTFVSQGGTDPLEQTDPTTDVGWREFRWHSVTGVVQGLAEEVRSHGKPISAAVFPTPAIARRLVRQEWDRWPLDMVFPMLYHRFYEEPVSWIGTGVAEGVRALGGRFPLYAGLYLPDLDPDALAEAIRGARDNGAAGFSLFEMNGITDERMAGIRKALG
jgi:uncharacterized lipoprotein YddW (UPF0748 family)